MYHDKREVSLFNFWKAFPKWGWSAIPNLVQYLDTPVFRQSKMDTWQGMVWVGPMATSTLIDSPHSQIKEKSVLKASMPYVCWGEHCTSSREGECQLKISALKSYRLVNYTNNSVMKCVWATRNNWSRTGATQLQHHRFHGLFEGDLQHIPHAYCYVLPMHCNV